MQQYLTFVVFLLAISTSFAKLPSTNPSSSPETPASTTPKVAMKDFTDSICQLVIEGNLTTLNERINNGVYGGSHRHILSMLNKLGIPHGKGCTVNVMKSIHISMKEKGIDPAVELDAIKSKSDDANAVSQLRAKYPNLTKKNAQSVIQFLRYIKLAETNTTQTSEAALPTIEN